MEEPFVVSVKLPFLSVVDVDTTNLVEFVVHESDARHKVRVPGQVFQQTQLLKRSQDRGSQIDDCPKRSNFACCFKDEEIGRAHV